MPIDIVMPRLSDTMTEGTVARWLKKPGDTVKRGEAIAEIETDKALMQYEAFEDGTLGHIEVGDGQSAPLGARIASLLRPGEAASASASSAPAEAPSAPTGEQGTAVSDGESNLAAQPQGQVPAGGGQVINSAPESASQPSQTAASASAESAGPAPASGARESDSDGPVRASPLARRIAAEHGLELASIQGTGPGGRIVRADVEETLARGPSAPASQPAAQPASAPAEFVPLNRIQTVVARRMVESKSQVPHIYITTAVDMTAAMKFRADSIAYLGKESGFSVNDLFVKASALALRKHPIVNATQREGGYQLNGDVNVGNAVAIPNGLVVPVVRHADRKSLPEIGHEMRALAEKARAGRLQVADYEGGTFTISNLGMFGVEEFGAIVNQPQVAILAVGAAAQEPVVVDGQLQVGFRCRLTLSADHRVVYGADAAEFLRTLKSLLEAPLSLVYPA